MINIPPESQPKITLQKPKPLLTAEKNLSFAMYLPLRIPSKSTPATFVEAIHFNERRKKERREEGERAEGYGEMR